MENLLPSQNLEYKEKIIDIREQSNETENLNFCQNIDVKKGEKVDNRILKNSTQDNKQFFVYGKNSKQNNMSKEKRLLSATRKQQNLTSYDNKFSTKITKTFNKSPNERYAITFVNFENNMAFKNNDNKLMSPHQISNKNVITPTNINYNNFSGEQITNNNFGQTTNNNSNSMNNTGQVFIKSSLNINNVKIRFDKKKDNENKVENLSNGFLTSKALKKQRNSTKNISNIKLKNKEHDKEFEIYKFKKDNKINSDDFITINHCNKGLPIKIHEKNINCAEFDIFDNQKKTKPLRFEDVQDPEAFAFFQEKKYLNKDRSLSHRKENNMNKMIKNSFMNNNTNYKTNKRKKNYNLENQIDNKKNFDHHANLTASKFRSENFMRSFYEENKNEKSPIKKSNFENDSYHLKENNDNQKSEAKDKAFINFYAYLENEKTQKKGEFDYDNVDTPIEKQQQNLDPTQKILNTIKLISKNKKNFKETNKILREIGTFYEEKKDILKNFKEENENDKLLDYIGEYKKIELENKELNDKLEKIKSTEVNKSKKKLIKEINPNLKGNGFISEKNVKIHQKNDIKIRISDLMDESKLNFDNEKQKSAFTSRSLKEKNKIEIVEKKQSSQRKNKEHNPEKNYVKNMLEYVVNNIEYKNEKLIDNNERTGFDGMILKTMKKWNKSIRTDEIGRKQKVALKMEKVKSNELFEKVFLKNHKQNNQEYDEDDS